MELKYTDPEQYVDTPASQAVAEARRQQLKAEWLEAERDIALREMFADIDQQRVNDMPDVADDDEDPERVVLRERKRSLQSQIDTSRAQIAATKKSAQRKKKRASDAGAVTGPAEARKDLLAFFTGANNDGYLARLEQEYMSHKVKNDRRVAALAMTGPLALDDAERQQMQTEIEQSTEAMATIDRVYAAVEARKTELEPKAPAKATNRAARRANGGNEDDED